MSSRTIISRRERLRRLHEHEQQAEPDAVPAPEAPPRPRKRRRRKWLLVVTAMLLAVVWFLPGLVAHTPLLGWLIDRAAADLDGKVTIRWASLGWFSPLVAEGLEVRDAQDRPVLKAERITGSKSLAALLLNPSMLGAFRVEAPQLHVELRPDGSNVEDVLAAYLEPRDEPAAAVSLVLEAAGGTITLVDAETGRKWPIKNVELKLATSAECAGLTELDASGDTLDPAGRGGFSAKLTTQQQGESGASSATGGALKAEADGLPLAMLGPLAARFLPGTRLDGRLSSRIDTRWSGADGATNVSVEADLSADGLTLSAPPLGNDRLELDRVELSCKTSGQGDALQIERSSLRCDVGELSAHGSLALRPGWTEQPAAWALSQAMAIRGEADLAKLAAMLPETLRIRRDTRITSGRARVTWSGTPGPQGMAWQGEIHTSDLSAEHAGRQLAWQGPVQVTFVAHETSDGPVVDDLRCDSQFLKVHAAGSRRNLAASASFDLEQLRTQLGQFVDLGEIELAGNGWAQLNWQSPDGDQFEADAELQLRDFQLVLPERLPWREPHLLAFLSAAGSTDFAADTQLQRASLQVRAGVDRIDAELTQPVLDMRGRGNWPVKLTASGRLENWPGRLATWIPMGHFRVGGKYHVTAEATGSADGVHVRQGVLTAEELQFASATVNVDEPRVEVRLEGAWDQTARRLRLGPASLTTQTMAITASDFVMGIPSQGTPELQGTLEFRGRLEDLERWLPEPPAWQTTGRVTGNAAFEQADGRIRGRLEADVADLVLATAAGQQVREPQVRLTAAGDYEHAAGLLTLESLRLASGTVAADLRGRVTGADEQMNLDLAGQLGYDLERITTILRPYLGRHVRIGGRGLTPVSYRGPLAPAKAAGQAELKWEWAQLYGFPVDAGQVKANLGDGLLAVEPVELEVSGGRVQLAPQLRLAPGPAELSVPPGPLATRVQVTPPMCEAALKYIAPVLAGVTDARGDFSIELTQCRVPLHQPARSDLVGTFTVHDVEVGPGPLLREFAVLFGYAAPGRLKRESVVRFHMADGRVHHEGLELVFPELTVRTQGSVGLDQSLALVAEMPVPPKWTGNNPLGTALKDQTIRLPVAGTLDRPQLDRRAMQQYLRQSVRKGVENVLEHEVGRQLERLFGPPE